MKIINGECLAEMDKLIAEGITVDAIITDPPYGITACKWDSVIPFDAMWERLNKLIKPNGAIVLFGSEPFSSALRMSNIKNYKYDWIWEKSKASNFLQAGYMPLKCHENISIFVNKNTPTYNPQFTIGKPYDSKNRAGKNGSNSDVVNNVPNPRFRNGSIDGQRKPRTIQYFKTAESEGKTSHPTQKPVALMEYLIKTYTNEGETVLDFTMGSGSTGVACVNTNRDFIGIELDEGYFTIAEKRIKEAHSQGGLF